jgi:hypothetical protein
MVLFLQNVTLLTLSGSMSILIFLYFRSTFTLLYLSSITLSYFVTEQSFLAQLIRVTEILTFFMSKCMTSIIELKEFVFVMFIFYKCVLSMS